MRKRTVLVVLTLTALLGLCGGCGEPEKTPVEVANEFLTSFAAMDFERCNELTDPEAGVDFTGGFSNVDAYQERVIKAALNALEIGDMSLTSSEKKTAVVSAEVECLDGYEISLQVAEQLFELKMADIEYRALGGTYENLPGGATEMTDELWEQVEWEAMVMFYEAEDAPKTKKQIDIDLVLVDGEWKFSGEVDQLVSILCGF